MDTGPLPLHGACTLGCVCCPGVSAHPRSSWDCVGLVPVWHSHTPSRVLHVQCVPHVCCCSGDIDWHVAGQAAAVPWCPQLSVPPGRDAPGTMYLPEQPGFVTISGDEHNEGASVVPTRLRHCRVLSLRETLPISQQHLEIPVPSQSRGSG